MKNIKKPGINMALALGVAISSVGVVSVANAGSASVSPFEVKKLTSGCPTLAMSGKSNEGKCGEGKCGSKKKEAKCGEAKCGAKKKKEGKCGEGKCGSKK